MYFIKFISEYFLSSYIYKTLISYIILITTYHINNNKSYYKTFKNNHHPLGLAYTNKYHKIPTKISKNTHSTYLLVNSLHFSQFAGHCLFLFLI